jgi:hypothetical protein
MQKIRVHRNHKSNVISIGEHLTGRYRSADEQRAEGGALRDTVPRDAHGDFRALLHLWRVSRIDSTPPTPVQSVALV